MLQRGRLLEKKSRALVCYIRATVGNFSGTTVILRRNYLTLWITELQSAQKIKDTKFLIINEVTFFYENSRTKIFPNTYCLIKTVIND